MSDNFTIEEEPKKPNILVRVIVIAAMLLILFFIALAIVKYVPKIISAISPANVSLTSLFNPGTATTTSETSSNYPASSNQSEAPAYTASSTYANTSNNSNVSSKVYSSASYTKPSYHYTSSYQSNYAYTGPSDLAISLVKVGQVNTDGSFTQTSAITPGSRVQVQFMVANVGSGRSGSWNLQAILPTSISLEHLYNSVTEPAINPGASYLMTLAFDSYDPSQSSIQISLAAPGDVNAANNTLTIPLTSNGYSNGNNNSGCYYSNGTYYCNGTNNSNGCYYSNGSYYCNNYNSNSTSNSCYWNGSTYTCTNNNSNNSCYYSNGSYYCSNSSSNNNCYYSNGTYYCNNNTSGNADLSVNILNVGKLDSSGNFTSTTNISHNDRAAVQFNVSNNGNTTSPSWTFTSYIPSSTGTYTSGTQNMINAGQTSQTFTVSFDYPYSGTQTIYVQLNPQGNDTNSGNNYASRTLYVSN